MRNNRLPLHTLAFAFIFLGTHTFVIQLQYGTNIWYGCNVHYWFFGLQKIILKYRHLKIPQHELPSGILTAFSSRIESLEKVSNYSCFLLKLSSFFKATVPTSAM